MNQEFILVVWASRTGNLKRFIDRLGYQRHYRIVDSRAKVCEPFLLLTYTASFGEIPYEVEEFLRYNGKNLRYVVGSGDRNWGENYCLGAKKIARIFGVPLLQTFELMGTVSDLENFLRYLERVNGGVI